MRMGSSVSVADGDGGGQCAFAVGFSSGAQGGTAGTVCADISVAERRWVDHAGAGDAGRDQDRGVGSLGQFSEKGANRAGHRASAAASGGGRWDSGRGIEPASGQGEELLRGAWGQPRVLLFTVCL